jgi:tRNA A58 N-methylase Trm61
LTGGALYGLYEFNTNDIGALLLAFLPIFADLENDTDDASDSCFVDAGLTELVKRSWKAASA